MIDKKMLREELFDAFQNFDAVDDGIDEIIDITMETIAAHMEGDQECPADCRLKGSCPHKNCIYKAENMYEILGKKSLKYPGENNG